MNVQPEKQDHKPEGLEIKQITNEQMRLYLK